MNNFLCQSAVGTLPMTKRQVRIWNRRRAEILRAIAEFKREEEMQPIAAAFESMVNQVDALVTQGFIDFNDT